MEVCGVCDAEVSEAAVADVEPDVEGDVEGSVVLLEIGVCATEVSPCIMNDGAGVTVLSY